MDQVGIKYVNNMYVVCKNRKFNLFVVATTTEDRKIGSSVFLSYGDLKKLYEAVEKAKEVRDLRLETEISSGKFLLVRENVPCEEGIAEIYHVKLEDDKFVSKMPKRAYDEFVDSVKQNDNFMNDPEAENEFDITEKKVKKPKKNLSNIISFTKFFKKKEKKGVFDR